jgi:hypothetical protein
MLIAVPSWLIDAFSLARQRPMSALTALILLGLLLLPDAGPKCGIGQIRVHQSCVDIP